MALLSCFNLLCMYCVDSYSVLATVIPFQITSSFVYG